LARLLPLRAEWFGDSRRLGHTRDVVIFRRIDMAPEHGKRAGAGLRAKEEIE